MVVCQGMTCEVDSHPFEVDLDFLILQVVMQQEQLCPFPINKINKKFIEYDAFSKSKHLNTLSTKMLYNF